MCIYSDDGVPAGCIRQVFTMCIYSDDGVLAGCIRQVLLCVFTVMMGFLLAVLDRFYYVYLQ